LSELLEKSDNKEEWEKYHKFKNDPRVTSIGLFLRKTSIDEIPQFVNVLKGDMSIIGPRPLVEGELEQHNGDKKYWNVKPGITGWWACNGRSNMKYDERLKYEYYYIDNVSFILDIKIFIKTIISILRKIGSY
jgi:undecaprenyl-phosphate galactose phosphotransferase